MSVPASIASSQNVVLPLIPELYSPDFLDILLPVSQNIPIPVKEEAFRTNALIDALKANADRTFTNNGSPAYGSTGSATLDAFQGLKPNCSRKVVVSLLTKAWAEDPNLTVRIIWNCRSIHDGKGDRETFYRYVATLRLLSLCTDEFTVHLVGCTSTIRAQLLRTSPSSLHRDA